MPSIDTITINKQCEILNDVTVARLVMIHSQKKYVYYFLG